MCSRCDRARGGGQQARMVTVDSMTSRPQQPATEVHRRNGAYGWLSLEGLTGFGVAAQGRVVLYGLVDEPDDVRVVDA